MAFKDDNIIADNVKKCNVLDSFAYACPLLENVVIPNAKDFLLDSGAFTFFSKAGGGTDWRTYIKKYAGFINRNNIKKFFELDIDSLVGYSVVRDLRKELEDKTGRAAIPVWHKSRGIEEFKQMCEDYRYVAIGGLVSKEIKPGEIGKIKPLLSYAHNRGRLVHGLGFTNLKKLREIRFDSVDSSSWTSAIRFGTMYKYRGGTLKQVSGNGARVVERERAQAINFCEWAKFAEYMENK